MKNTILSFTVMAFALNINAQNMKAITGGNIIDVNTGKVLTNQTILIDGNKIVEVSKAKTVEIPKDATIINAKGKWILPGMVDAHVHFFQSAGLYTRPDIIDLRKYVSYEQEIQWLKDNWEDILRRYTRCGITTTIDDGGPVTNFEIRELANKGNDFPTLFVTGALISTYQPDAFKIEDPPIIKVNSPEEARAMVNKQIPYHPDFIKIWYIVNQEQTAESNYPIIKATIEESHKNNLKVAVHATQLETAHLAVKAGADILVHSVNDNLIDDAFIQLLKTNKVIYVPTLIVSSKYKQTFSQKMELSEEDFSIANPFTLGSLFDMKTIPGDELSERILRFKEHTITHTKEDTIMMKNLKRLSDAGVIIATGTDAGNIGTLHASSYYQELSQMKAAGLTNAQILKASTINGAKVVGKEKEMGSIEKGKIANLLILDDNPLTDIMNVKQLHLIINKGNVISPDTLLPKTPEILAQRQLNAYNAGNIDAFLDCYSNDVEVYTFPNELSYVGLEKMRERYAPYFKQTPDLHCELIERITIGNKVIDRERVTGFPDGRILHAVAIYEVVEGKISKVYFMK